MIEEITLENESFWKVKTTEDKEFISKNIFIAAGAGSFEPRRPPNIEDPDKYLGKGVEYAVRSVDKYKNKNVVIFGGGDSALDWTVELSKVAKLVTLVHRRDAFRGAQHTEEQMRTLVEKGKVNLLTPYLINSIEGDDIVESITLKNFESNEIEDYEADELLFLFGLNFFSQVLFLQVLTILFSLSRFFIFSFCFCALPLHFFEQYIWDFIVEVNG